MKFVKKLSLIICFFVVSIILGTTFFSYSSVKASSKILTISALGRNYDFYLYETTTKNGKVYLNNLDEVVEGIYLDTLIRPTNAYPKFTPNNKENPFIFNREKVGVCINKDKLKNDINYALNHTISQVLCEKITLCPDVYVSDLPRYTTTRSSFSTTYNNSSEDRKHNIKLATSKINGTIILPGEEFSFNKVVGSRTLSNGFKESKVILNGEYVLGVGGGVCQVSTTLYNALLLANLKVTERHSHSLQVSYVEPSFDAMVSENSSDLKFINNTIYPLYIRGENANNTLSFTIYGYESEFLVKRLYLICEEILPPKSEVIKDDTMPAGESKIIQQEKAGIKSQAILEYYKNGKKVKNVSLHKDTYKAVKGKIVVGTKQVEST